MSGQTIESAHTMDEAATLLRICRRALQDLIARHPYYYANGRTKNGQPRAVHLAPVVVAALASHPRGMDRRRKDGSGEKVFRFTKCGRLYTLMGKAKKEAGADLGFVTFHILRHTWATWMRRYAGLDLHGLVATEAWADPASAARYAHVVASEEGDYAPVDLRGKRSYSALGQAVLAILLCGGLLLAMGGVARASISETGLEGPNQLYFSDWHDVVVRAEQERKIWRLGRWPSQFINESGVVDLFANGRAIRNASDQHQRKAALLAPAREPLNFILVDANAPLGPKVISRKQSVTHNHRVWLPKPGIKFRLPIHYFIEQRLGAFFNANEMGLDHDVQGWRIPRISHFEFNRNLAAAAFKNKITEDYRDNGKPRSVVGVKLFPSKVYGTTSYKPQGQREESNSERPQTSQRARIFIQGLRFTNRERSDAGKEAIGLFICLIVFLCLCAALIGRR